MASSSSSEDETKEIHLSKLLSKPRDDLLINLEKCLIENDLPIWDGKSNSKLHCWIKDVSSRLDVSLSINILKLMTCYVMGSASYDENVVMEIYLFMLSLSSRVADSESTERYTKISFWESITELNMALLDYNESLISKEVQVVGLQLISIVVTSSADHFLRQLYIKSLNNLLETFQSLARTTFKQQAHESLVCLPECLAEVGDYDFQTSIVELIFRTTGISERKANINKIFPGLDLTIQSLFLRIQDFDPDCRQFLNKYNTSLGDKQLVFTFPCHNAQIGQLKLSKPKSTSYEKFWVDFNLRSGTILIMCDRSCNGDGDNKSSESTWESLVLYPNEVTSVQLSCLPHTTTLVVELGRDPSEIFASPPTEVDRALLSEWFTIEFNPNKNLKRVCQKLYNDKIIVHDMTLNTSHHKVSKTAVAVSSKAFSSSETEVNNKPSKSSFKQYKMSKTKVPIPAVVEDSSSGNQLWSSSAVDHITTTTKDVPTKVPRKKMSKTCIPIKCASHSESNTASANSGVTDEDKNHPNKESMNLFQNIPRSKMEIEASTSKENAKFPSNQSDVSIAVNSGTKESKLKQEPINKDGGESNITEGSYAQESIFTKQIEIEDNKSKKVVKSKIETSPLKIKDAAKQVVKDSGKGCTSEETHTQENNFINCSVIDDYKGDKKDTITKEKEKTEKETSPLKIKDSEKKMINCTDKSYPKAAHSKENVFTKCSTMNYYNSEGENAIEKKKESKMEKSQMKIKDSVKKVEVNNSLSKKSQLEKIDSIKDDVIFKAHTTMDNDDKPMSNIEGSIHDETKIIEKEFNCPTENIDSLNKFMNETTLIYPRTPSRNEYDKKGKSPIIGVNSLNKLSEIISSASPEKKMSACLSLETECEYAMPTQDQGILLEAMDTLDDIDINKDLSSTEVKLQNSEDEVDVDIESEEEIPSSIATPSATTPLSKLKKNKELSISKKNSEGKHEVKANEQNELGSDKSITLEKVPLSVKDESKSESRSDGKSKTYMKDDEKCSKSESVQKIENTNLIGKGEFNHKDVEECKPNEKVTPRKSDDEIRSKRKTSQQMNDTITEKCVSQNKVNNQNSEIASTRSSQHEESNIDLDEDDFSISTDNQDFTQPDDTTPSKVKEVSQNNPCTPTEKLFEKIDDINMPLKSLKNASLSHDNQSSSPKKITKSPVKCNKEQDYLRSPSKTPKLQLATIKNKTDTPRKKAKYQQYDKSSNSKSPKGSSASVAKKSDLISKSLNLLPIKDIDSHEQKDLRSPSKSPKGYSPAKKCKSEQPLKIVNKSPIKNEEQDHSQVFKHTLRSRKCKSSMNEPAIKLPVKEINKLSNMENSPQCKKFKDFSSLLSPKSTKKHLLIKSKSSSQEPAQNFSSQEPAIKSLSQEPVEKLHSKELSIKSPVKELNNLSDLDNTQELKFKDFSSLISSQESNKKKKNLLIKTQPKTRASSSRLSENASPKKEGYSYKAVVKVIDSPKMIVEITKASIEETTEPIVEETKAPRIKDKGVNREESNSDLLILEKSNREDVDIMHVTSSVLSPIKEDLVKSEQHVSNNPISVNDSTFHHDDNNLIKKTLIAEIESYYVGQIRSSYSGKEVVVRYSKEITILDQITKLDEVKPYKNRKRGLFDYDLMIHDATVDSSQSKAKSPRKEDDKFKKTDRNMSEGLKSTIKILETYGSNVLDSKSYGKTPRKDEIPPSEPKIKNESNITRNKRNTFTPVINVTPNVSPHITPSNNYSEMKKSKKKLFNNSDLNILQDTPPSSQSPDVEIASLYQHFNSETKSSRKHNSSKLNVSNKSSVEQTKNLSVHSTYLESSTHMAVEGMCDSLESHRKKLGNKAKSIRVKKENLAKKSTGRNGSMISAKGKRGRPKKISNAADSQTKNNRFLASPSIDSPVSNHKIPFQSHSIYSDFSSEDEFGWFNKKKKEPRITVNRGYGKANWSYRRSKDGSSPEWRPVREKKKKRIELPKAPTPPKSYHSTSSMDSDSTTDNIFKPVKPKKNTSTENISGKRITRSFSKQSSNTEKKQETPSRNKHLKIKTEKKQETSPSDKQLKRKRQNELSNQNDVASWCSSISRPESPEILRQNSRSSVESQTPGRDFKLAPGRALEGIKFDISNSFGFSSPEMASIPEEPVQKRIRKSVDDTAIKGLLENILPKSKDVCRNTNVGNNISDTGVYPLAPNNTPVSPVITQNEESKKENNSYVNEASDKDETEVPFSPRQSTMIDDMASKTLPSVPQFSYVSEQLEESFLNEETIRLSGIDPEEKSKESVQLSPLIKSPLNTRLQLSVEDSPPCTGFLIPSQPWTPPQGEDSDSESEINHEDLLPKNPVVDLDQTLGTNEVKSAIVTSSEEDGKINTASPELFSLETTCPLDNVGTQAFSFKESGGKHIRPNTPLECCSLQSNQPMNKDNQFSKVKLEENKEKVCNNLVNHPENKTQTAQLLNKVLDTYERNINFEGSSQFTPTSHQNQLETPEVSQRRLFLNMDEIDISGLDSTSPITPTRRRMLMQQMEEFKTHITVSYTRSLSLWENVMKILSNDKKS